MTYDHRGTIALVLICVAVALVVLTAGGEMGDLLASVRERITAP